MNVFSAELGHRRFRTNEEMMARVREWLPDATRVVFVRPHHLFNWFYLHYNGLNERGTAIDLDKLFIRLKEGELVAARECVDDLLTGKEPPGRAGMQIEYLRILQDPESERLSDRDRVTLTNIELSESHLEMLAARTMEMYLALWDLPDTHTVVVARVFDNLCRLISQEGCVHCYQPFEGVNDDENWLRVMAMIARGEYLPGEVKSQIRVKYAEDGQTVEAVALPLSFLKDTKIMMLIAWVKANQKWLALSTVVSDGFD